MPSGIYFNLESSFYLGGGGGEQAHVRGGEANWISSTGYRKELPILLVRGHLRAMKEVGSGGLTVLNPTILNKALVTFCSVLFHYLFALKWTLTKSDSVLFTFSKRHHFSPDVHPVGLERTWGWTSLEPVPQTLGGALEKA